MKLFWTLVFLLLGSLSSIATTTKAAFTCMCDPVTDSLELVNFYQNFNGPGWADNNNWLVPGQPIDTWFGIITNVDGCVQEISISNNNLIGVLYDFNFPELVELKIFQNQISGTLVDFQNIPLLEILSLGVNQLEGEIPDFTNLPNLIDIKANYNSLSGEIPDFTNLPNLEDLIVEYNSLNGEIPNFTNLPNFKRLRVGGNNLSGEIPNFTNLPNLIRLRVEDNNISGEIPNFTNLPNLVAFWVRNNNISGEIPDFTNLPNLEDLIVSNNNLSGEIPDFTYLPNLVSFWAKKNNLSGEIPDFTNLPNLKSLILGFNNLSGEIPDFTNLPNLEIFWVSTNNLIGGIPDFSNLPNLISLFLHTNNLTGEVPDFTNLPNLEDWEISNNNLSGEIPDFTNLPNLANLRVQKNNLSGEIPELSSLVSFHVTKNNYTFSDIIMSNNFGIGSFLYAPQGSIFQDTSIQLEVNQILEIDLGIDESLNNNFYEWYKDSLSWVPPPGNDTNSNMLIFPGLEVSDAGRYYVIVTNTQAPDLTLYSHQISLQVCDLQMDSLELVELYNATGGGVDWIEEDGWLIPGTPIGEWYGVTPNEFGCVQKLDLSDNGLNGQLPELSLNTLDTLILDGNGLDGIIPELEVPFIKYISLENNGLSGGFPLSLNEWYDLTYLNFSHNTLNESIPPDLGDLCDLESLYLDNNNIGGELPEELTRLFNLQIGQVDFSVNEIDSLKDRIIWFCPFGDTILQDNVSYDRFLGICNVECTGEEWDQLMDFPWIMDTLNSIDCIVDSCLSIEAKAGFVDVRGIKVLFTSIRCYSKLGNYPEFIEETCFYDCAGHRLETAFANEVGFIGTEYGAISGEEFENLFYDVRWTCGQTVDFIDAVHETPSEHNIGLNDFTKLKCSPNPADVYLTCELKEQISPTSITVFDLLGQKYQVRFQILDSKIQFDLSRLNPGFYLIRAQGEKTNYLAKVVVH